MARREFFSFLHNISAGCLTVRVLETPGRPRHHAGVAWKLKLLPWWLMGWIAAAASGAAVSSLFGRQAWWPWPADPRVEQPTWMQPETAAAVGAAVACYEAEAARRGGESCAPTAEVVAAVWASCWPQEEDLFSKALDDTDDDLASMTYLQMLQDRSRHEFLRLIEAAQVVSGRCTP
ncbi:MAG: hypothetical protein M3453_05730 [Pseudomonadota bacterium]|nr:hypothetical protein [Pseudomonadota bacterium]